MAQRRTERDSQLVYSTEPDPPASTGGPPRPAPLRDPATPPPAGDGIVRVGRQTHGRKGKGVTVITGLALTETELARLATRLKRRCGSGGAVKVGAIEIQGDHRDRLVEVLQAEGWQVKRAGG